MTITARDLVEAGAIDMARRINFDGNDIALMKKLDEATPPPNFSQWSSFEKNARAALIATFRKLAEDGPTEALQLVLDDMTDEACAGWRVVCRALLRELEDLTP